jgi:hypothetical protein
MEVTMLAPEVPDSDDSDLISDDGADPGDDD